MPYGSQFAKTGRKKLTIDGWHPLLTKNLRSKSAGYPLDFDLKFKLPIAYVNYHFSTVWLTGRRVSWWKCCAKVPM